jgi:hypothetical protein
MKKSLILLMVALFALGGVAFGQDRPKVLLVATEVSWRMEFMIEKEVRPMVQQLNEAEYDVVIASETGTKLGSGANELTPDIKLDQVKLDDYKGVIFPCMASRYPSLPKAMVALARSASEKRMPIAAQENGIGLLGAAQILDGKKYAMLTPVIPGGIWQGVGIAQDGNIITSATSPYATATWEVKDGTPELMEGFIRMLRQ